MMGVSKFLLECIAEDEESARHPHEMSCSSLICTCTSRPDDLAPLPDEGRVLAECEAKRRIIKACDSLYAEEIRSSMADADLILTALATVYGDHPGRWKQAAGALAEFATEPAEVTIRRLRGHDGP
jgi:hypothetical protein